LLTKLVLRSARRSSSASCSASFCSLIDFGRDDVEDSPAQDPQLSRPEVSRLRDQVCFRVGEHPGWDLVGRKLVERMRDHLRLCHVEVALTERGGHVSPALVERLGEHQVTTVRAGVGADHRQFSVGE